jgi:hypothetical protein
MIRPVRGIIVALLLLLGTALSGRALALDEKFVAPAPPADRVLDESRVLARDAERRQAIAKELAALEAKHGFRMYFVLYDSLFGRNLADRARELQEAWLGGQPGMVVVLETDSRNFKVGRAPLPQKEIEPGKRVEVPGPTDLAPSDLSAVVRELEGALMTARDSGEFAERLGAGFARGVSGVFDERAARPEGGTKGRMIALAIGLIAVTGLVALLVVAGLKRAEARSLERYVFPKISVGMRLGAPYGGGKISSRSFGRRPRE